MLVWSLGRQPDCQLSSQQGLTSSFPPLHFDTRSKVSGQRTSENPDGRFVLPGAFVRLCYLAFTWPAGERTRNRPDLHLICAAFRPHRRFFHDHHTHSDAHRFSMYVSSRIRCGFKHIILPSQHSFCWAVFRSNPSPSVSKVFLFNSRRLDRPEVPLGHP